MSVDKGASWRYCAEPMGVCSVHAWNRELDSTIRTSSRVPPESSVPAKTSMSSRHETIEPLGRFWTVSLFESEFMGASFSGRATSGYDPQKGKWVGTWIDSMMPHLFVMEGDMDADGRADLFAATELGVLYRFDEDGRVLPDFRRWLAVIAR